MRNVADTSEPKNGAGMTKPEPAKVAGNGEGRVTKGTRAKAAQMAHKSITSGEVKQAELLDK